MHVTDERLILAGWHEAVPADLRGQQVAHACTTFEKMSERSLLVTEGYGFVGAHFVHFWLAQHPPYHRTYELDVTTSNCSKTTVPILFRKS